MHYKKEYAEPLRNGVKLHTIRKRKVSAGLTLKHIVYPYHKDKLQSIEIVPSATINDGKVYVEGRLLSLNEMQRLAWNDGFVNLVDFWMFFNEYFKGYIIHWTNLQY